MFISRMHKKCAIPQLVSAPLNPIPIVQHLRYSCTKKDYNLRNLSVHKPL